MAREYARPARRAEIEKKPRQACPICSGAASLEWLARMTHTMAHEPIPAPATARAMRRSFRETLRRAPSAWRDMLLGHWSQNVKQMPGLALKSGRPRVEISGLVLYVLTALTAQIIEHARDDFTSGARRDGHFAGYGEFVGTVYQLASEAPDFDHPGLDRAIVARYLGIQRKVVDLRLRQRQVTSELDDALRTGRIPWLHWNWLIRAIEYRRRSPDAG